MNNYGPFQFPEKLIPLMILHALDGKPLSMVSKQSFGSPSEYPVSR